MRSLPAVVGSRFLVISLAVLAGCAPGDEPRDAPAPVPEVERAPLPTWEELAGDIETNGLNVVLVTIDTLRADRLSSYGSKQVSTPHMDRLAREGVRFSNAATTVPFTLPAHSSIMTGAYPPFHGVRENVGYSLDDSLPTLAEELSAGGWATAGFVSAFVLDSRWGIGRGFDHYRDDFQLDPNEPSVNVGQVQHEGTDTIEKAHAWLDQPRDAPFFLWVHLFEPHDPYTPPEPYRSRYPDRTYDAEVAYTDSLVGLLREGLESRGVLDDSVFVLTSDHGEGLGQHGEGFHGYFIYDSTVRVPLILRLPFGELAGQVVDEAVSHVDILPTVLSIAGRDVPPDVQGSIYCRSSWAGNGKRRGRSTPSPTTPCTTTTGRPCARSARSPRSSSKRRTPSSTCCGRTRMKRATSCSRTGIWRGRCATACSPTPAI